MMIEGSGSKAESGSIPLTNGSGSGRPKNVWIRWIRIRNTEKTEEIRTQVDGKRDSARGILLKVDDWRAANGARGAGGVGQVPHQAELQAVATRHLFAFC